MKIRFKNPKHEALVNNFALLSKKYNKVKGIDSASEIIMTIDILQAANNMADIPPSLRPHPLKGNYKGCFAVNVDKKHRNIFEPDNKEDIGYRIDDYKSINKIIIIEIFKDYH